MTGDTAVRVAKALLPHRNVVISFHAHPDGDAAASAFLLGLGLISLGKQVWLVNPDGLPQTFGFLADRIPALKKIRAVSPALAPKKSRCLVLLDSSNPERASWEIQVSRWSALINIDHHADNSFFGTVNLVDSGAPAVSELIVKVLAALRVRFTAELADLLFVSLYSDTAGLTITSDRIRKTLLFALRNGADVPGLNGLLRRKPISSFLLQSRIFGRIVQVRPGLIWSWADFTDLKECGSSYSDFDSITEEMSRIKESEIFFLLKPISSGRWKVSIRSRRVNVRNVAAHFGGGGHDRASGFEISGTPKHCAARIIALIPRGR